MSGERILIVEDDASLRLAIGRYLSMHDYEVSEAATCASAVKSFTGNRPDVLLTDYHLPDGNGVELIGKLRQVDKSVPMVVLTGHGTIELAVKAIKEGAEQFLTKPVDHAVLLKVVERLAERRSAQAAQAALSEREARSTPDPFVGTSPKMKELKEQALRFAQSSGPILLQGETGSGKGVLTRWMHAHSDRAREHFVDLNCAGLSRELLENELFGHERGAFTGAQAASPGLLEAAHKGWLFLDEIGDVDSAVQPRLLKVLEEQRFRRLGDVKDRSVDVRLIAATHHDLGDAVRAGRFRSDLYFRISVLPLRIPPLRERAEDIPALSRVLLGPGRTLTGAAERALQAYSWPGNVRELRNVLERARVLSDAAVLDVGNLHLAAATIVTEPPENGFVPLEVLERRHIQRALKAAGGNVTQAAEMLGMARSSLYERIKRQAIAVDEIAAG